MKDIFEIEVKDDVTRVSAFICRHGDENIAEAEALKAEVYAQLGEKYVISDGNFLTAVVLELNWEYSAGITGIHCDQWSMVCADSLDEKFKVTVQCDIVEDGIAAVYKAFREHHGTPVPDE